MVETRVNNGEFNSIVSMIRIAKNDDAKIWYKSTVSNEQ